MNISQRLTIDPGIEPEDKPDAIKIIIADVTVLVEIHTGIVTVEGADDTTAKVGEHNTLEIYARPSLPKTLKEMLDDIGSFDMTRPMPIMPSMVDLVGIRHLGEFMAGRGFSVAGNHDRTH